jgi:hypothetical protein
VSLVDLSGVYSAIVRRKSPDGQMVVALSLPLPAGRNERMVVIDADGAETLLGDSDSLTCRSLAIYGGIWTTEVDRANQPVG